MTTKIGLQKNILNWLMKLAEKKLDADNQNKIAQWNIGTKKPTFAQLSQLTQKLHIPLGYLFLKNPPDEKLEILDYRVIDSESIQNPSRELIDTLDKMKMIQGWMREYMLEEEYSPFPYGNPNASSKDELVKSIRKDVGLQEDWYTQFKDARRAFNYLRKAFSSAGVTIMMNGIVGNNTKRPLRLEEFRAFAMYDEYAPLVFINGKDNYTGRCFSLVHEIAHIWLKKHSFYNATPEKCGISQQESICNAVATEILATVANKDKIVRGGNYRVPVKSRIDPRFFKCLYNSVLEGKTRYTDAFRLTDTTGRSLIRLASELK